MNNKQWLIDARTHALTDPLLARKSHAKTLAAWLADRLYRKPDPMEEFVFPQGDNARAIGMTRWTAFRARRELERAGYIKRLRREMGSTSPRLIFQWCKFAPVVVQGRTNDGAQVHQNGCTGAPAPVQARTTLYRSSLREEEDSKESSMRRSVRGDNNSSPTAQGNGAPVGAKVKSGGKGAALRVRPVPGDVPKGAQWAFSDVFAEVHTEAQFMGALRRIVPKATMEQWGGWWVSAYRHHATKAVEAWELCAADVRDGERIIDFSAVARHKWIKRLHQPDKFAKTP